MTQYLHVTTDGQTDRHTTMVKTMLAQHCAVKTCYISWAISITKA